MQDDATSDLEIERVFRLWCQSAMNINMSSDGFFNGMQINADTDVFAYACEKSYIACPCACKRSP